MRTLSSRLILATLVLLLLSLPLAVLAQENVVHLVRPGETLSGIARQYGVSTSAIVSANGLPNPNFVYIGQRLVIPGIYTDGGTLHTVASGETLFSIAARYNVTVAQLVLYNGIYNPNMVYVGQILRIPPTQPSPTPSPQPTPLPPPPTVQPKPTATPNPSPTPAPAGCDCEQIVIASPSRGITITSPVTVTGLGSGFEQTVVVAVLDGAGGQIGLTPGMVIGPYGQQGAFTTTVPFAVPANSQLGRIQVWSVSPRDGAIEHLASVTVMLQGAELDPLLETLERAIAAKDYAAMQQVMAQPFRLATYRSQSVELSAAQAIEQLRRDSLGPGAPRLDFSVDARKLLGERVKFGPEVLHVVYSPGWGAARRDDAFLLVGIVGGKARWTGLLVAPAQSIDYR